MAAPTLLPDPMCLHLLQLEAEGKSITATVKTTASEVQCPQCESRSTQVHSRYLRVLADLPWMGCAVRLLLHTRRFFCTNPDCQRKIFTERVPSVVARYARRTLRLEALPARMKHDYHLVEDNASSSMSEVYQVHPEAGGMIEVQLTYQRGPLLRRSAEHPNFPLWAAVDPTIMRVYQEDSVQELLRNDFTGLNMIQNMTFRSTVAELADLFDGKEQLVAVIGNPHYMRKVFSPHSEQASREE
jgi:hypothetical protein